MAGWESSMDQTKRHTDPPLKRIAPFVVLPMVFLLAAFAFARIVGPFYSAYNYDPDYVYLFNGLNLASLQSPEHIDHPGTPLQLLLALAIRLANLGVAAPQTAANVIGHAETYLAAASVVILLAYASMLVWAGVAVAKRTGSLAAGWLVQSTPFLLGDNFLLLLRVNPEPMLLLLSLALAPFLIEENGSGGSVIWSRRLRLSFLVATGLCIKITFLPVFVVVLLAETGRANRLWHAGLVAGWSLLWTFPIWNKYSRLFEWFWGLALKQGPYARGPVGFISAKSLFSGLATLLWANKIYSICLLAGLVVVAVARFKRAPDRDGVLPRIRLLACLVVGGLVQLLISAKNPQSRYLAPSLGLIGLNLAVVALILAKAHWLSIIRTKPVLLRLGAGAAAALVFVQQTIFYQHSASAAAGRNEMCRVTSAQQQGSRIFYYGASSPVYAVIFGNSFAGHQYSRIVERLIYSGSCQTFVFNNWTGDFYSLRGRVALQEITDAGVPVLLHGDRLSDGEIRRLPPGTVLRELRQFEDERIYELRRTGPAPVGSGQ